MRLLIIGYLTLVHAAAVGLAAFLYLQEPPPPRVVYVRQPPPPADPWIRATHSLHGNVDHLVPAGATVFLGDSITQALDAGRLAPGAVNFGISSQRTDHLLASLDVYRSLARAGRVVLTIGTNDLKQGREAGIEARYDAILAKIPGPVVMSGVFPMPAAGERVAAVVDAGRQACARRPHCTFVDAYAALKDQPDALAADGVHLTARGYKLWAAALREAIR